MGDCFVHAVDDLPASFRASGPLPDNSRKARVPVCRQHGMPPDVPPHGLAIPYYNKYIGIGMSARQLQKFKSYHILQRELWKANSWNASVLFLPFGMMCIAGGFRTEDMLFFFSCLMAGILYLQIMALFRWVCPASAGMVMMQLAVCIPLFAWTCFVWAGCLAGLVIVGILSYVVWIKWKAIWK